jgi:hypothetical protein
MLKARMNKTCGIIIEIEDLPFDGKDYCLDTLSSFGDILLAFRMKVCCLKNMLHSHSVEKEFEYRSESDL